MTDGKGVNVKPQTETIKTVAVALAACCWWQRNLHLQVKTAAALFHAYRRHSLACIALV